MKKIFLLILISFFLVLVFSGCSSNQKDTWTKIYDSGNDDFSLAVVSDSANNVIVTGYLFNGKNNDFYTLKYDSNGNVIWSKSYDGGKTIIR